MKTIEQILELIKLNAYSGTTENIQAIVELVNEAQNQALPQADVSGSLPLFKCKCGYETSNSVAWCTHADCCNGNDR